MRDGEEKVPTAGNMFYNISYLVKKRSNLQLRALIILHGNSQSILNRGVIFFIVTALYTLSTSKKKSQ